MFTFCSFFIGRFLSPTFFSLVLFALGHELVVAQPVVNTTGILSITTKQQASLGVQVAAVQASTGGQLLASATVVMLPGKEFTVSAPYAGQVSRLLVGVGDSVKAGAALAHFTSPMLGDARRLLNEASLEYKNSSAAAQRDQAMFDEGIIPAVRLQLSRSKQASTIVDRAVKSPLERSSSLRILAIIVGLLIVFGSAPGFVRGSTNGDALHDLRHLSIWQVAVGLAVLSTGFTVRFSRILLVLVGAFLVLTGTAAVYDAFTGHRGPWTNPTHMVEVIAALILLRFSLPLARSRTTTEGNKLIARAS